MHPNQPTPIRIPEDWADSDTLTFEDTCQLLHVPQRTARDWRRRRVGPHWHKLDGTGRLYTTVAELRRFLTNTASSAKGTTR